MKIQWRAGGHKELRVIIDYPDEISYTYPLKNDGTWEIFPFSSGDGKYTIQIFEQLVDTKYYLALGTETQIALDSEFAQFIQPNKHVDFGNSTIAIETATTLVEDTYTDLEKVEILYNFVINNFTYDYELAETVQDGYLTNLDDFWEKKSGICLDYATLLTSMLRSQGIPAKLVIGDVRDRQQSLHAWTSVFIEESGRIKNGPHSTGNTWVLLDPTFVQNADNIRKVLRFVRNEANYHAHYLY